MIIISQELPVVLRLENENVQIEKKRGRFASGLNQFFQEENSLWVGSPGLRKDELNKPGRTEASGLLEKYNCRPVFLSKKEQERGLDGFSNRTIWPLFHYFTQNARYLDFYWEGYKNMNRRYADRALEHAEEGDKVWVHDYHMLLVPKMIRDKNPDLSIGFFLHIPFPSYEIFRLLPWREQILEGLLASDLIGFHTYDYERHFMSCVRRLLGYDSVLNRIHLEDRIAKVDFFPLGINYQRFADKGKHILDHLEDSPTHHQLTEQRLIGDGKKLILSIDRLDYTKGIPIRLLAYEQFLQDNPQYLEKVSLVLIVMPSRESVELYKSLKRELDEMVGRLNSRFGTINWMPIWYFYRQMNVDELVEYYIAADVALITPVRDGMNLISKEYLASKSDGTGVLILSEMAGAAKEMGEATIVNPNNRAEMAKAIKSALETPVEVQVQNNRPLHKRLHRYTDQKWAREFMQGLAEVKKLQESKLTRKITSELRESIREKYAIAGKRIIFLDYDGTLTGFHKDPQEAKPDRELYKLLKALVGDRKNKIVIISGRDKETLGKWFGNQWKIGFIAEHGVWNRDDGSDWEMIEKIDKKWMEAVLPALEFYVDRTPRSFIEEKNYSLVWHYRDADPDLGILRSRELKDEMQNLATNLNLEIMDGDYVIEVKNSGINKGRAALHKIGNEVFDYIMALGDDWTDEYTFEAMPEGAITIKVGTKSTRADYYVESVDDVRSFLSELADL